jgi:hypothetical protein
MMILHFIPIKIKKTLSIIQQVRVVENSDRIIGLLLMENSVTKCLRILRGFETL